MTRRSPNLPGRDRRAVRHAAPAGSYRIAADRHVAVVGGGIAGLAAATVLAERGVRVTLLDSASRLGGRVSAWELDDGRTIIDNLVFGSVSNTRTVGGMVRLKDDLVDLNDGQFEVMLVRDPGPGNVIELNKITTAILQGTFASPYIRLLHSSRAKFTFGEPVKWTRDGEAGGAHRTVTLENQHSAYSILL